MAGLNEKAYELLRASHPLLDNVNKENLPQYTTHLTTWIRYPELQREDAIIEDSFLEPLSHVIGEALHKCFHDVIRGPDVANYCILCHYCFDRALTNRDPAIQQVVILGGTLDTRAFRIDGLTNCAFFEMHLNNDLMKYKEQVLSELHAEPKVVKRIVFCSQVHDDGWKRDLQNAGFDPTKPTFWILESTLQFIKPEEVIPLLRGIDSLSVPHSQILTERLLGGGLDLDIGEDHNVSLLVHMGLRYGEDGGVFRDLAWTAELMLRQNQALQYYGTMWDPVRFDRLRVTGDKVVDRPFFLVNSLNPNDASGLKRQAGSI